MGSADSCWGLFWGGEAPYVFSPFLDNKSFFPLGQLFGVKFVFVNFLMQYPNRVLCIGKTFPNFVLLSVGSDILN